MTLAPPPQGPPRRLAYLGTPDLAVPPLQALASAGYEIALVVTQPDRRRGRGSAVSPSPVKAAALDLGLPVTDDVNDLLEVDVDLGVVVAYGRLIRPPVLERVPMVNLHFSLLPRWRGAAPVERAILAGDERTGVDLMVVEETLDTGAIYARSPLDIDPDETLDELRARLVEAGVRLLVDNLGAGLGAPSPQEGEPSYAAKIDPAELEIDWTRPAVEVHRLVRLGGAWTTHNGHRLKVLRTSLGDEGAGPVLRAGGEPIRLLEVQPAGKARISGAAWANGARWQPGDRLPS